MDGRTDRSKPVHPPPPQSGGIIIIISRNISHVGRLNIYIFILSFRIKKKKRRECSILLRQLICTSLYVLYCYISQSFVMEYAFLISSWVSVMNCTLHFTALLISAFSRLTFPTAVCPAIIDGDGLAELVHNNPTDLCSPAFFLGDGGGSFNCRLSARPPRRTEDHL